MADINKNLKSICSFYASEWHLVTMLLPNLDRKINKGVKVTTILEKDLTKEMETLLTKLHLEEKKEIKDKEKLEKYIDDRLEYSSSCISLAVLAISEAKLSFLEAIEAQDEYDELYKD